MPAALEIQRETHPKHGTSRAARSVVLNREAVNKESRTVELSFSSEEPYQRWWGIEILDHQATSVDLSRMNGGAAVLVNHNTDDQVGVVERAWIGEDRRGRAIVRFGRSARAQEIFEDVVDGIRSLVSVGYEIKKVVLEKEEEGRETYRVLQWCPLEISLVAIPADASVGVGRQEGQNQTQPQPQPTQKDKTMPATTEQNTPAAPPAIDHTAERKRVTDILALASRHEVPQAEVQKFITEGRSLEDFQGHVLQTRFNAKPAEINPTLGLSDKEVRQYSIVRALGLLAQGKPLDGLEREASEAWAKRMGRSPEGFFVPGDVTTRALSADSGSAGGYTVGTQVLAASMIELLRNRRTITRLGARTLSGLSGDIAIPRVTGGATAYWVTESGTVAASSQTFGQLALTPKRLGAVTAYSKKLLAQSSIDVEAFVRSDIAEVLAIEQDRAAINGSGAANEPRGLMNTTGVGSVTFGGAPTWAKVVEFETDVADSNFDTTNAAYLTTPSVRGKWKTTVRVSSTDSVMLWSDDLTMRPDGMVNGYRAAVTKQVPSDKVIFGDFSQIILAEWAGLDVVVDPYTLAADGQVRIVTHLLTDLGLRHAVAFSVSTDAGNQ